jgi:putative NIF3 family GTP cyclohydrolase 1 type 2
MDAGMALYSAHIPLDVHPQWGNNACLVREIGLAGVEPFFDWKGIELGLRGTFPGSRDELVEKVGAVVGGPVHLCPGGAGKAGMVGVITGGAGSEVDAIARSGVDTFVTGEGPHWSYPLAEELQLNVLYAGHYATETFGVKALAGHLSEKFGTAHEFIDHPTGL